MSDGAKILDKSLRVLRAFTPETPVLTAAELSRVTGVSLSAVYRFVATFRAHGLLELAEPGRLQVGFGLLDLASSVLNRLEIRRVARPVLEDLQSTTRLTAFLTVLRDRHAICVETVESGGEVRVCPEVGKRRPLHAGAPAKVLLAFMEPSRRLQVLRGALPRFTARTVVDPSVLDRQLIRIRARGYTISEGEFLPGVRAIAVPVRDQEGRVEASLSVAGLGAHLSPAQALAILPLLCSGADRISLALRHRSASESSDRSRRRLAPAQRRVAAASRSPRTGDSRP